MIDTRTEAENIDDRIAFYGDEVDVFINVGGNVRSMGSHDIRDEVNRDYYGLLNFEMCEELKNHLDDEDMNFKYKNTVLYEYLHNIEGQIPILNLNNIKCFDKIY